MTRDEVLAIADTEGRVEALLRELTLAEKVALLAGADLWSTTPVERLGIPAIKVTDGPNGARGAGFTGGVRAACFPAGIALAATWNTELVRGVGRALGEEAQTKGAHVLLGPTVNIHRSPLNGRNFECYSEDPYLAARMAVAYIEGLQGTGVGATVKHYVCNDSEFERNTLSVEVDERALREIYLPPFRAAVQEARTWAVMAAYNRINGVSASEHAVLLRDVLKGEWGFDGVVTSDWFGTYSTVPPANNGLDLEMPGPPKWRGEKLRAAVEAGEVAAGAVDEAARRVLRLIMRVGAFAHPEARPERAVDRPEHRALIRAAGAEGIVLLKNDGAVLPLDAGRLRTIAVIGPNARTARIMGGGSASVNAHYAVTPFDGVAARAGDRVRLAYELGCPNHKLLPPIDARRVAPLGAGDGYGFAVEYYDNPDLSGEAVHRAVLATGEQTWLEALPPGVPAGAFSARLRGTFTPQEGGAQRLGLASAGRSRLYVDGREVIDNWTQQRRGDSFFGTGSTEVTAQVPMVAGRAYELRLDYSCAGATLVAGLRLGHLPPAAEDSLERAAALAARSDVALLFVGLNGDWESEGYDRADLELAGEQAALIERVAAANPRTVVVLQTGSPVAMPWLERVPAVLQAWYPGQECGNAIADVLFGDVDATGRLPQTFPRRLEDNPAYLNYPGENGRVRYGEGLFVGYRSYERKKVAPLFPFGYGLSYTTFAYGDLELSASEIGPDDDVRVSVDVTNTGRRAGQEVVQLYVRDTEARLARPDKELKAFAKVALRPGETTTVTLALDRAALAYYDDAARQWVAEAGGFEILVGRSSADIRAAAPLTLTASARFGGPGEAAGRPAPGAG